MIKTFPILLLMLISTGLFAQQATTDTLTREQYVKAFTVKSDSLNQTALKLAVPGASAKDLNEAISLIMKGLHTYSRFRDSTGLRETFDHLAFVYHLQKKYVQAKWFYIQSNSLAREMRDTANIIHSLISLSSVKSDIKDFEMANKDLSEALNLAKTQPGIDAEIEVQNRIAAYYNEREIPKKIAAALSRIAFLKDSVAKKNAPVITDTIVKKLPEITKPKSVPTQGSANSNLIITVIIIAILLLLLFMFLIKGGRKNGE
ncbi:MAG: hypothetical protein ABIN91_05400 [Mucilaginibacter sp.]|uniref:hypothetical protein n=1 Tax=Mucilaginibacter sp. TaxID=1882438 RepID=UPI003266915D